VERKGKRRKKKPANPFQLGFPELEKCDQVAPNRSGSQKQKKQFEALAQQRCNQQPKYQLQFHSTLSPKGALGRGTIFRVELEVFQQVIVEGLGD